jgi:hypothetical protein
MNKVSWEIIKPEIKNDLFYNIIIKILQKCDDITNILEIGASSGDGSTEAFIIGKKNKNINLFCIEVCTERFNLLKERYTNENNFFPYNISSVSIKDFPTNDLLQNFFKNNNNDNLNYTDLNLLYEWLNNDINYININNIEQDGINKIKNENNINFFDMVLIDGSEFTGIKEFEYIYGAKYILLDDIKGYKNFENHNKLKNDINYKCLIEDYNLRNGFSIFKKKTDNDNNNYDWINNLINIIKQNKIQRDIMKKKFEYKIKQNKELIEKLKKHNRLKIKF